MHCVSLGAYVFNFFSGKSPGSQSMFESFRCTAQISEKELIARSHSQFWAREKWLCLEHLIYGRLLSKKSFQLFFLPKSWFREIYHILLCANLIWPMITGCVALAFKLWNRLQKTTRKSWWFKMTNKIDRGRNDQSRLSTSRRIFVWRRRDLNIASWFEGKHEEIRRDSFGLRFSSPSKKVSCVMLAILVHSAFCIIFCCFSSSIAFVSSCCWFSVIFRYFVDPGRDRFAKEPFMNYWVS